MCNAHTLKSSSPSKTIHKSDMSLTINCLDLHPQVLLFVICFFLLSHKCCQIFHGIFFISSEYVFELYVVPSRTSKGKDVILQVSSQRMVSIKQALLKCSLFSKRKIINNKKSPGAYFKIVGLKTLYVNILR